MRAVISIVTFSRVSLAFVLALMSGTAFANGVVTERRAGGLVFKKTDTIGTSSEELFVSRQEIRVSYIYNSTAKVPQNVLISFPMPEIPLDDGPDTENALMNEKILDKRNYMNFKIRVDGREIKARLIERALFKGADISARLKRDGVPLLLAAHMQAEKIKPIPESVKKALVSEELFSFYEGSGFYSPNWNYQVLFEWEQDFKPGQTKVDISYRPIAGDSSDYGDYFDKGAGVTKYCVDPAIMTAIKKASGRYEVARLGYVLKTARFWNGPIGKFRLVVDKESPENLVAFCPQSAKKISPTQFEWTATNFVPDRDLEVVFFLRVEDPPN
jgi:Domain of unknown function (DUF4424)